MTTYTGDVEVDGGTTLTFAGAIDNTGSIALEGNYNSVPWSTNTDPASLVIAGNVSLSGGGEIALWDGEKFAQYYGDSTVIYEGHNSVVSSGAPSVLTNVDNTIEGGGTIGDSNLTLINKAHGVIEATSIGQYSNAAPSLTLDTGANTITNAGLMEALSGATLNINSAVNNTGTIEAVGGSTVVLHNVSGGGMIEAVGTGDSVVVEGVINSPSGSLAAGAGAEILLEDGTLLGGLNIAVGTLIEVGNGGGTFDGSARKLNIAANVEVDSSSNLALLGTIDNTGTIALEGNYNAVPWSTSIDPASLVIAGNVTLSGGGEIALWDGEHISQGYGDPTIIYQGHNSIVSSGVASVLTNVDNTIAGGGTIGDADLTLINKAHGVIEATSIGQYSTTAPSLTLDTGANTITNAGLMEALIGATLNINSAVNSSGTIAANGGNVTVEGILTGAGEIDIYSGNMVTLESSATNGVTFENGGGNGGTLVLEIAQTFTGKVAGLMQGDEINLANFDYATTTITKIAGGGGAGSITNVTLTDSSSGLSETLHLINTSANEYGTNASDYLLSSAAGTLNFSAATFPAECFNAAEAVYQDNSAGSNGGPPALTGLIPFATSPTSELSDGFFAQAFHDKAGNVIIAFEGSILNASDPNYNTPYGVGSRDADIKILLGFNPSSFNDAHNFVTSVEQQVGSQSVYLTGHSLGAAEAEYVGFLTGLPGMTFGAPGIPSTGAAANFVDYVDYGDPIGNFRNHYGTVEKIGSQNDSSGLTDAVIEQLATLGTDPAATSIVGVYHSLANYGYDLGLHLVMQSGYVYATG